MNNFKPVLNAHQKAKQGKPQPPKTGITPNPKLLLSDSAITRDSLELMMNEYFKKGGKLKRYDQNGHFIGYDE
jgi:hypothetical protein